MGSLYRFGNGYEKDKSLTRVYSIPMNGGEPIAITGKDYSGSQPRWSPDNKYLSF
jgi:Tol biopolymer transport system component